MSHQGHITEEPVTVERLDWCLDRVALAIHMAGDAGDVYLPIYARLERERLALDQHNAVKASVQSRLSRLGARPLR